VKPASRESETYQLVLNFIERHTERPVSPEEIKIDAVKDDTQAIPRECWAFDCGLSMSNAQREALVTISLKLKPNTAARLILVSGFWKPWSGAR